MSDPCERVLRTLPRWFGIESSLVQYARDTATCRFYASIGYTPLETFPTLWGPKLPVLQLVKVLGRS